MTHRPGERRFVTFGVVRRDVVIGENIAGGAAEIYNALISAGFRETVWQLVFDGQLGGLVSPFANGTNEIHVRFYSDRIVAEFEVGRAYVSHFSGPRLDATEYLIDLLDSRISGSARTDLERMTGRANWRTAELAMSRWNWTDATDPFTGSQTTLLPIGAMLTTQFRVGWKQLAIGALVVAALAALVNGIWIVPVLLLPILPATQRLPSRGNP